MITRTLLLFTNHGRIISKIFLRCLYVASNTNTPCSKEENQQTVLRQLLADFQVFHWKRTKFPTKSV